MSNNSTRRRFLTGSAALTAGAAVAVPAVASAGAGDAELLALGRQFDGVLAEHKAQKPAMNAAEERLKAGWPEMPPELDSERATPWDDLPRGVYRGSPERLRAVIADPFKALGLEGSAEDWAEMEPWHTQRLERARARAAELLPIAEAREDAVRRNFEDTGYNAACAVNNEICDRLDALAERIREIPPMTLAGVAVKARALLRWDASELYRIEDDADWDQLMIAKFVNELAGLPVSSLTRPSSTSS
jgi:hypothetical protein